MRTFGVFVIRKQVIFSENISNKKHITLITVLKRGIFNFFYWTFIFLIFIFFIKQNEIQDFETITHLLKEKKIKSYKNTKLLFFYDFLAIISSIWSFFILINYLLSIFKKNKLGISELISKTRIVDLKHFNQDNLLEKETFFPKKIKNKTFSYFNEIKDKSLSKEENIND